MMMMMMMMIMTVNNHSNDKNNRLLKLLRAMCWVMREGLSHAQDHLLRIPCKMLLRGRSVLYSIGIIALV